MSVGGEETAEDPIVTKDDERAPLHRWFPSHVKPAEWIMIAFTAVTALASWGAVFVANRQLGEMRSGSVDTHNLAVATQNLARAGHAQAINTRRLRRAGEAQAQAADAQAASTKALADGAASQLEAIKQSASAATLQATASGRQADAAVLGSKANDRLAASGAKQVQALLDSDRPWAGTTLPTAAPPTVNADWSIIVPIINSGRSPALDMKAQSYYTLIEPNRSYSFNDLKECFPPTCQQVTAFPGSSNQIPVKIPKDK